MSKITLTSAQDIALDRLVASDANVRRIKAGVSVEELAQDIARRGLLQSLSVRPLLGDASEETGKFAVSAGGRRFAALKRLVKQKRLAKNAPVPCIVKADGIGEEDSLAENTMREALHPLDQFRAFKTLNDQGLTIDEIAARFFVAPQVVRQRLKLVAASQKLLDLYVAQELTLDQLSAFCVTDDHQLQEREWEALQRSYSKEPYMIRRMLTEGAVRASDKRAIFVGIEAYKAAGGVVLRDLFAADQGGWLQDVALLDRLAREKLSAAADAIRAEGWKWTETAIDFPYGHTNGLRRLTASYAPLSEEEQACHEAALADYNSLSDEHEGAEDLPEEIDQGLAELEQQIATSDEPPAIYDPADIARAGIFVSIDHAGPLKVERGFVRPEDEAPAAIEEASAEGGSTTERDGSRGDTRHQTIGSQTAAARSASPSIDEEETDASPKLSDRLLTELTAHRTLALRNVLAIDPEAAFLAATHALALSAFYRPGAFETCVEIGAKSFLLGSHAPALSDAPAARALDDTHGHWQLRLPEKAEDLWAWLIKLDHDARASLFAHCVGLSVNALYLPYDRRPRALAHADRLAEHLALDMSTHWSPTVESYFGKVTKAQILAAVREAKGAAAAQIIDHLKKSDMGAEAERLLQGSGWLPEILRATNLDAPALTQDRESTGGNAAVAGKADLPAFLAEVENGDADDLASSQFEDSSHSAIAAE
ncbi:ParB/RepB/Spo0J family partition protein [Methylocystis sp. L43]|jgi:ParB family chromosome partitioning protein|uniref:ParB/RepB/Spo0J family partition protein n=1 Tax=Methylocystis rosea TaxID=173366 RepID=A0ABX6EPV4_9HYPH|nr:MULTISPECIES: ParB/RepB/Spo0J family partition protein [Methylocystis]MBG0797007.1 ParB/RepB/Spo0J family partition protein [Methylocystis sp. L43]MBG0804853.1 ParB/RepB/Spo0J family partition protein [Methylocystis sp. H15]QGM95752.1 ParB/RepB/Spo0J family partition protein [Methylocystis rosea]